jgi:hypothetical protein
VFKLDLLLRQGLGAHAVVNTHCSVAATMEAILRVLSEDRRGLDIIEFAEGSGFELSAPVSTLANDAFWRSLQHRDESRSARSDVWKIAYPGAQF